eukprot:TRINITY_DN3032_c0_g1_i1.p1 TRINITY_DN3032_c0_g1~~TRINITY_DN3032_c0_g1_i1.p1  ORF type:complete len:488 (-),score=71.09 TRINITY_DN3032_c0_g1_i1:206-1669(-)
MASAPSSSPGSPGVLFQAIGSTQIRYKPSDHLKVVGGYVFGKQLGEGSYTKVKEGVHLESHKRVAIKIYHFVRLKKIPGAENMAAKEIQILTLLKSSPNIISAIDIIEVGERLKQYVILQYVDGGTLERLLDSAPDKKLPLRQSRHIFKDLVKALQYLKEQRVVHRDLKPDNILLSVDGDAYISDFGVALILPDLDSPISLDELAALQMGEGSLAFQPPECHQSVSGSPSSSSSEEDSSDSPLKKGKKRKKTQKNEPVPKSSTKNGGRDEAAASLNDLPKWLDHPFEVDIWSLGIVLFLMTVGTFPFPNSTILALFQHIAEGKYTIPSDIDSVLGSLIRGMLTVEAKKRLTISAVRKHAWLRQDLGKSKGKRVPILPLESRFGTSQEELLAVLETIDHSSSSSSSSSSPSMFDSLESDSDSPQSGSFGDSDDSADDSFASEGSGKGSSTKKDRSPRRPSRKNSTVEKVPPNGAQRKRQSNRRRCVIL